MGVVARFLEGLEHSVQLLRCPRLARHVHQLGDGRLHPESQFVIANGRFDGIAGTGPRNGCCVEPAHEIELAPLPAGCLFNAPKIRDWVGPATKDRGLKRRRQESVVKALESARGNQVTVEDDESGQVAAFGPQSVQHPRPHARPADLSQARMQKIVRAGVFGKLRGHRTHDAQVVGTASDVRQEIADVESALSAFAKLPRRLERRTDVVELRRLYLHFERQAVLAIQPRLGVERIDLRRPAVHVEKDDPFGPRGMSAPARGEWIDRAAGSAKSAFAQQRRQRNGPEATRRSL